MDFEVTSGTTKIRGAFHPASSSQSPCIIVCHGMPAGPRPVAAGVDDQGNDGLSYEEIAQLFSGLGIATVIFNFRGTGASTGDYHPMGWVEDLQQVITWVQGRPEIDSARLGIMGSSMGAVIAIKVASGRDDIRFLVTYASPSSISRPVDVSAQIDRYRVLGIITTMGFPDNAEEWAQEFENIDPGYHIGKVTSDHVLLVHGDADDVVPVDALTELFGLAPPHAELRIVKGAGHRFRSEPRSIEIISEWIGEIFSEE